MKKLVGTIDCEPTWESLLNAVKSGHLDPECLRKAVQLADVVRQSQKRGSKSLTFEFEDKNEMTWTEKVRP